MEFFELIKIMIINFIYAIFGVLLAFMFSKIAVKMFDNLNPYDTQAELENDNRSVGMVVSSIYIGTAILVGLIIGLGIN